MSYSVRLTKRARDDINRLYRFLLTRNKQSAARAYSALDKGIASLSAFPFSCRKADPKNSFLREMIIPFGDSGYVILFEVEDSEEISILAIRHQREDDYH